MRIKSYRQSKRGFQLSSSLLRIIAASAVAGMTLAQISDKPAADLVGSLSGNETGEAREPCAKLHEDRLPMDAVLQRNKPDGSIRSLKGSDLSLPLEQNGYFRLLQRESRHEEIARCFLQANKEAFKLRSPLKELQSVVAVSDEEGRTHVRLRQLYAGLPVRGGEITVHLTPDQKVYLVEGRYYPTPAELGTEAHLGDQEAASLARESLAWDGSAQRSYQTEGAVYVGMDNRPRLAYRVMSYQRPGRNWEIWIDANTGEILSKSLLTKSHL
jgi:hypothetical protein